MGKVTEMSLDGLDPMFSETPTRQGLCPWCSAPCAGSFCDYCCREVESRRQSAMILQVNVEMGLVRSVCARAKHRRKSRAGNFADSCEQCGHVIALDADN